ncbi:MAG: MmgE/PrpD family protein [Deltaproteobacteria bacterium]|nr:MmgE/PrpD family protein [Deltaproteobacteria bacterium]
MGNLSTAYADFVTGLKFQDLPPEVVGQAKKLILDLIGVALAGQATMEFPRLVIDYVSQMGGKPEATVIGLGHKVPAANAALANAASAHALDMDDGHRFGAVHPGTVVIPAALAAAELGGAGTRELIAGVVAGYEVMIRLAKAINPSSLNRGFHATGVTGPLGAAAAAALILGLDRDQTVGAFGLAGLQGSGVLQVNHDSLGAKVKPINPAKAAQSGLLSALLALKGARGPLMIFEGRDGFLQALSDQVQEEELRAGLGRVYEIMNTYLKLYAACRHAHAAVDAARSLWAGAGRRPEEIERITVETYPAAIRLAGIAAPATPSAARFSTQFAVALAVIAGGAGADRFTEEEVADQALQGLAGKVELVESNHWARLYPVQRGATVTVTLRDGQKLSAQVALAKGEPENPADWEEIRAKFTANSALALEPGRAEALAGTIDRLEEEPLSRLTGFL